MIDRMIDRRFRFCRQGRRDRHPPCRTGPASFRLVAALSTAAFGAGAGIAQTGAGPGPDIVVTAPTPLSGIAGGRASPTLTGADIAAAHATDLTDYLRRLTGGVFVNDVQGNPLQPDINYRGFTASPLLGTAQGLSVYLDGVRLNQPFGDVVSWDLLPRSAIRSARVVPGVNPLFGRNSLGGTLAITTKDGRSDPGYQLSATGGSFGRRMIDAQAGGEAGQHLHWFVSADLLREHGWRDLSPSRAAQGFAKLGWSDAVTDVSLSGSLAATRLNGNGLQEMRLLEADRRSIYTAPDITRNRAAMLNLAGRHTLSDRLSLSGNVFWRRIATRTYNGDVNDDALGENVYQPSAAERAALAAAGYSGFPASGETQSNTPFPKWRCIAEVLLNTEPNEKCDGLANRSSNRQREWGGTIEAVLDAPVAGLPNRLTAGLTYIRSRSDFQQSTQFAYLLADRTVVAVDGPGAFADGSQQSENAFDARVDLTGRTRTFSAYALDALDLGYALRLEVSARYDRTVVHNRDRISPGGGTGSLDSDPVYHRLNPAIALRWTGRDGWSIGIASSRTSRAPSAIELGCADPASPCRLPNALAGDPPLRQVVAHTNEGDVALDLAGLAVRLAAFRTDSHHDLLFVTDEASGYGYFRNFGTTRRQGFDVDLSRRFGTIEMATHYTYLDATYRSREIVGGAGNSSNDGPAPGFEGDILIRKGDRLPLIPRHLFKASLAWAPVPAVSVDLDMIASAGMIARGNENGEHRPDGLYYLGPGATSAYAVFNAGGEIRPTKAITIFAQIANLFDRRYASAAQLASTAFDAAGRFVARPFAGPVIAGERPLLSSTFYAPGAPRSIQVGARLRF